MQFFSQCSHLNSILDLKGTVFDFSWETTFFCALELYKIPTRSAQSVLTPLTFVTPVAIRIFEHCMHIIGQLRIS